MDVDWTQRRGPDRKTFGERLRERREAQGYIQSDLGRPNTVGAWEAGETVPGADKVVAVARKLDCNAHWLLTGEGEPDPIEGGGAERILHALEVMMDPRKGVKRVEIANRLLEEYGGPDDAE